MAFYKRTPKGVNTTPVLDRTAGPPFWITLAKTLGIPLALLLMLFWFGNPNLRVVYKWNGNKAAPSYHKCLYLSLTGWHQVYPAPGINQCPLVTFTPLNISKFLGGQS